ncbi:unnamed protein product [Clonostachys rosea]|uniref:Nephrocystin 3-like N-terminal domain-containing protein n=1 Tax=Bionectria ochroleuca TaxID=29856 RepID=A0ABY6ULX5_BIOOC|nr:unnamed protein product [Clonostachys rosea]
MSKVYRATNLPEHVDRLGALELLARCIPGITLEDIKLGSLAVAIDPWALTPTKTATLTLKTVPTSISEDQNGTEWAFPAAGLVHPVILDTHFYGLTPLNEVEETIHTDDCIVISGLASHPVGSWQPRGQRSFMWIRDSFPARLPGVRFILYGYDSRLAGSKSFQVIPDLALSLINQLRAGAWGSQSSKSLLFLAHSLGGVILKQAMVMLAGGGEVERHIISGIKGGAFFGVPSMGMEVSDIFQMLGEQPNRALIDNLSDQSDYIPALEKQFEGISHVRDMVLIWAYETEQTPTLLYSNGYWSRSGPGSVMVSPESATGGRYPFHIKHALQLNHNHSNMIKFKSSDREISILALKIQEIVQNSRADEKSKNSTAQQSHGRLDPGLNRDPEVAGPRDLIDDFAWFSKVVLLRSFAAPERNERLEQIGKKADHTFDWVFDDRSIGLSSWLLNGEGIFWISGKPGSGKSTMLKFVWNNEVVAQLLNSWDASKNMVIANFFFHHRGTLAQKSFEGLLRSVLSQILEAQPKSCVFFREIVEATFPTLVERWKQHAASNSQVSDSGVEILEIPPDSWTQRLLKDCLKAVMLQNKIDMDIFLLFDALDEYDGPPEFIADFLKKLISTKSRTRVKILFSSRPWKIFQDEFELCPGFEIQKHTENDIRQYILNCITPETPGEEALLELTEDIVRRSRGVFLWVKLVLQELTFTASKSLSEGTDSQMLGPKLHEKLTMLPDQLDKFYDAIIDRLPDMYRWETYVLLESLIRSRVKIITGNALEILALSRATNTKEATRLFKKEMQEDMSAKELRIQNIKTLSGGLIEIIDDGESRYLQLMHQTVYEFVERIQFRHSLLGLRGKTTIKNGHSFLSTWYFYRKKVHKQKVANNKMGIVFSQQNETELVFHAKEAERTTGISQHGIFASGRVIMGWHLLKFAIAIGLRLLVRDILRENMDAIAECSSGLLPAMIQSLERDFCKPIEAMQMLSIIVKNGYRVGEDWDGILDGFDRIWKWSCKLYPPSPPLHGALTPKIYYSPPENKSLSSPSKKDLDPKEPAAVSLENCVAFVSEALKGLEEDGNLGGNNPPTGKSPLLHRSPPELVSKLLMSGANPHIIDSTGSTALDTFLASLRSKGRGRVRTDEAVYDAFKSFITHGATLQKEESFPLYLLVDDFKRRSYPTGFVEEYGLPKGFKEKKEGTSLPKQQVTSQQDKRKHRSLSSKIIERFIGKPKTRKRQGSTRD